MILKGTQLEVYPRNFLFIIKKETNCKTPLSITNLEVRKRLQRRRVTLHISWNPPGGYDVRGVRPTDRQNDAVIRPWPFHSVAQV